ncbi:MAG: VWA domain-containing protein [Dysgonamonadaceae bacterium]|jgi:hypothetical protein|nr:VWA domain-containing protein [Dysgonamonadaceae bacterium]
MKKILIFTVLLCFVSVSSLVAQTKSQRRIYLWDVTLSMKGKAKVDGKPTANIYDDVVEALCRYINGINNENTEILVLPFQEKILPAIGPRKATLDGKEDIEKKIRNFNLPSHRWTNIFKPLSEVVDNYLQEDKNTVVYLLTDGIQDDPSANSAGRESWKAVEKWNTDAGENNFLYYVYLTEVAKDPKIDKAIEDAKKNPETPNNLDRTDGNGGDMSFLNLTPPGNLSFNLKDNKEKPVKSVSVTFIPDNGKVPNNIDIHIKLAEENPYFNIDQIVRLNNNTATFEIKFKNEYKDYEALTKEQEEKTSYKLMVDVSNSNKIIEQNKVSVSINPSAILLDLINKREKTLKITLKKK